MANEFLDLFNQMFYSTAPWGYIGITVMVLLSLVSAQKIKHSWIFGTILQMLMVIAYVNAGSSYQWHIILLVFSAVITIYIGVEGRQTS